LEALNDFKSYRVVCIYRAQQESAVKGITKVNVESLIGHLRELKEHEDEIRKVRQELETQVQIYNMSKLIGLEKCEKHIR
jgi:hypothetical protein